MSAPIVGQDMHGLVSRLYPFCRSITGKGVRETLRIVGESIPLDVREVPTGTRVFDWIVPKEWSIREAYVEDSRGQRLIDFRNSSLHVVGYSVPVRRRMGLAELKTHLFSVPEHPDWIPWRNSYYSENWGFCVSDRQLRQLEEGEYEVVIDSSLADGHLTYGECFLEGEIQDEVLVSSHVCHPSLCNDNLSGIAVATALAKHLGRTAHRYSYRFLFTPVTIGSITWLALNESRVDRIKHGLVVACAGDPGRSTYKRSRRGNAEIDRTVHHVLKHSGQDFEILDFSPYGYDERQFCSPGFDLPVGCLMRTPYGKFPEYHTSADNPDFVRPEYLGDTLRKCWEIVCVLEGNRTYLNENPKCEPQLGRRGLYRAIGGQTEGDLSELALLWVLNLSDGRWSLLDIAERSGLPFRRIRAAADALEAQGLLRPCPPGGVGGVSGT